MKTTLIALFHAGLLVLCLIVIGIPEARSDAVILALRLASTSAAIMLFWRAHRNGWLHKTFSETRKSAPATAPSLLELMTYAASAVAVTVASFNS